MMMNLYSTLVKKEMPPSCRCPYYALAEDNLYGEIPGLAVSSTQYFTNLTSITNASNPTAAMFLKVA
jgi:hypothetical protein